MPISEVRLHAVLFLFLYLNVIYPKVLLALYHDLSAYQPSLSSMTCLLFQICFYFTYMYMFVRVNAMCVQVPMKSRGAGDPGDCALPNVDSGN